MNALSHHHQASKGGIQNMEPLGDLFAEQPTRKELRPYQKSAVRNLYQSLGRAFSKRVCLVAPTAFGKTLTATQILRDARSKGRRVAFCVPAISLIDQTVEAFEAEGLGPIGVQQSSHPREDATAPVQVCSVQTLAKRGFPAECSVVLVDECHIRAEIVRKWMQAEPETMFVGLTATPGRAGMADEYDRIVVGATAGELIRDGYLSPYRVFAPSAPDMSNARTVAGDFHKGDARDAMDDQTLTADIVSTWLERAYGQPTLLFAMDRAHAKNLQGEFEAVGVRCGYQDAFTDAIARKMNAEDFAAGRVTIMANVGTLTTGVDWDVRCIILARPTKSKMLHTQIIGRGLRTAKGKTHCIVLDHAGNFPRLGFVEDLDWSAFPTAGAAPKVVTRSEPLPKTCQAEGCSFVMPPKVKVCPACGHERKAPSGFIETEDGELIELDRQGQPVAPAPIKATKEDKQAWWSSLLHEQRRTGKALGWAKHTFRDKFGVWPRGLSDISASPLPEVLLFIRAKNIRFAKSRAKTEGAS